MKYFVSAIKYMIIVVLLLISNNLVYARSNLIRKVDNDYNLIAFTFDGGSDSGGAMAILDTLKEYNIKSTFFVTGRFALDNPVIIKRMQDEGHEIANHSYSHPNFTKISDSDISWQLDTTDKVIIDLTGKTTKPLFRPPYGSYNSHVLDILGFEGYTQTIYWSVDTLDWTKNSSVDIKSRILNGIKPGGIVLMHLSGTINTSAAIKEVIPILKEKGYRFVTVSKLLTFKEGLIYNVHKGDTLYKIANQFGVSINEIAMLNNIVNINHIKIGQQLLIPKKESIPTDYNIYYVKTGDTLNKISGLYGVSINEIIELNNIEDKNRIFIGQKLLIPKKEKDEYETYIVIPNDTLYKIAIDYNVGINDLVELNNIENINNIYIGQRILIPRLNIDTNTVVYIVKPGDSLHSISRKFRIRIKSLLELNNIEDRNLIYSGQRLIIKK